MYLYPRIFIFLILLIQFPAAGWSDELVTGEVVSVDRDNGEVILRVRGDAHQERSNSPDRKVKVRMDGSGIPGGVRQGRIIRVWGTPGEHGSTFSGSRISPGCGCDRTGIRGRLRKVGGVRGAGAGHGGFSSGFGNRSFSRPSMRGMHRIRGGH
jgi:hypothetical protein